MPEKKEKASLKIVRQRSDLLPPRLFRTELLCGNAIRKTAKELPKTS